MSSIPPVTTPVPSTPLSSLKQSKSLPNLPVQSHPEPSALGAKVDSVSLQTKGTQTEQAAEKTAKTGKHFYQPVLDFFKNLYQKFMDLFTPTSKEALEKSLAKAGSKERKYSARIFLQQALQSPEKGSLELQESLEALTPTEQEFIIQDGQKAKKKLNALTPKIEKLYTRYEKLISATTAPTTAAEKAATAATAEGAEHAAKSTAVDATEETAESLEKGLKEFAEDLAQQGEESLNKIKPVLVDFLEKLKVFLK